MLWVGSLFENRYFTR